MIGIGGRHAHGAIQIRQRILNRVGFGLLNPSLDLTDGLQILVHFITIIRAEFVFETFDFGGNRIKQTGPFLQRPLSILSAAAFSKERLEYQPWLSLRREWRRR